MMTTRKPTNILFVCSWNSCRSQMAEGIGKAIADDDFAVRSAGIKAGGVNGDAIATMREIGIDISGQTSDVLTPTHYEWADVVVTVCDSAKDNCPRVPAGRQALHWSIRDPYGGHTTEDAKNQSFREVRNELQEKITDLFGKIRKVEL